jgi:hypothetical protein
VGNEFSLFFKVVLLPFWLVFYKPAIPSGTLKLDSPTIFSQPEKNYSKIYSKFEI